MRAFGARDPGSNPGEAIMEEISLVYMVAGLSSRYLGKTKALVSVGRDGESLLEVSLNQALPAGFSKIVFIVSDKTESLFRNAFGNAYKGIDIYYALQGFDKSRRDKPWGTVDALCSAEHLLTGPFVICSGDDLHGKETFKLLFNHLKTKKNEGTVGYRLGDVLAEGGSVNRGIFDVRKNHVLGIKEVLSINRENLAEKDLSLGDLCSMNVFAFHPEVVGFLKERLTDFKNANKNNRQVECLLPVEISSLVSYGKIDITLYSTKGKWMGITNPGDEEVVKKSL